MKFESKEIDLKLELNGLPDNEGKRENKIFFPKKRPSVDFAEEVIKRTDEYVNAQKSLPVSEQDKMFAYNIKILKWIFKDLDVKWISANFTTADLADIREWAVQGLMGIKKDDQS